MTFLSLFAGIGGIDLGLERAGMRCIGQVEIDPYCRAVLARHWPDVPRFEDVRTFHGGLLNERPDLIAGGFPCQDISYAGTGAGIDGSRSGLWSEFYRLICEIRPAYVIVENVPALIARGIGRVLGDLARCGLDIEWGIIPAAAFGAPHLRERIFIFANARGNDGRVRRARVLQDSDGTMEGALSRWAKMPVDIDNGFQVGWGSGASGYWRDQPDVGRVANGVPARVDRLRGLGNAVVPQVAEWIGRRILSALPPPHLLKE